MNSHSITDYILKLEKENSESRNKIEQLKKLFTEASEEKVNALNELNDLKYKNRSLFETTARVPVKTPYCKRLTNVGIVERLTELGRMTSDFHKTGVYQNAANTVADLTYTVESGESLMHLNGIGKGVAAKINEYLDELDSDYEGSESSDSESIASNGDESDDEDEEDYFISQNAGLAGMLYKCAEKAEDKFKCDAYTKAGDTIYNLSHVITSGKEAIKFPGIGKSIAKKIDDYLNFNNATLAKCFLRLGNHAETQYKSDAYWNASDKLRNLTFEVTCGDDVKHIKGFGPSICSKIDEYITTGTMARLEELK
jgi:DNA polymerase/3'-5' exonuclease PolX